MRQDLLAFAAFALLGCGITSCDNGTTDGGGTTYAITITSSHILTAQGLKLAFTAALTPVVEPQQVTWSVAGNNKASFDGNILKVAVDAKPGTITVTASVSGYPQFKDERTLTILPSAVIAAAPFHTAAIRNDGTLWAWGWNIHGQLGNNSTIASSIPVQVHGGGTWVSLSAGYANTAAIRSDGTLWAWGFNRYGQLGNNTTTEAQTVPVQEHSQSTWRVSPGK